MGTSRTAPPSGAWRGRAALGRVRGGGRLYADSTGAVIAHQVGMLFFVSPDGETTTHSFPRPIPQASRRNLALRHDRRGLEPAERREFRPRYSCPAAQSAPERQQARRCAARLLPTADPPGDEIPRVVVVRGLN